MIGRELLLSETDQEVLAVGLYRNGLFGIKENPEEYITLKSGRRSPHYLNIRPGISSLGTRDLIVDSMIKLAEKAAVTNRNCDNMREAYAHLAGTPEAMTSYAAIIADRTKMSLLQPRVDTQKKSGNTTPILGDYIPADFVAEFDDVVTDGDSKITTVRSLGDVGLNVVDYFVVLDREEGGAPQVFAETGLQITPELGVSTLMNILNAETLLTQTQSDNVLAYMAEYGEPHAQLTLGIVDKDNN